MPVVTVAPPVTAPKRSIHAICKRMRDSGRGRGWRGSREANHIKCGNCDEEGRAGNKEHEASRPLTFLLGKGALALVPVLKPLVDLIHFQSCVEVQLVLHILLWHRRNSVHVLHLLLCRLNTGTCLSVDGMMLESRRPSDLFVLPGISTSASKYDTPRQWDPKVFVMSVHWLHFADGTAWLIEKMARIWPNDSRSGCSTITTEDPWPHGALVGPYTAG